MPISYFFDSSAIIKAYVYEPGSLWVNDVMARHSPAPRIFVSEVARVEVVSTLYRIEREKHVDPALTNWARNKFEHELQVQRDYRGSRFIVVFLTAEVFGRASALLERYRSGSPHALHSLDSIQLSSAVAGRETLSTSERSDLQFVTADKQLAGCAQSEGFAVISPLTP